MTDQMCVTLPALHLGSPTQVGPLALFPVWADAPLPANPIPLGPSAGATVGELDTPTVELLAATNPTAELFALLEGTVVDGGWQHRVLIQSVLVGARASVQLPVRCVEQGRWGGDGTQRVHERKAPLGVQGASRGLRKEDRPTTQRVDQGDVWSRVATYEQAYGASPTSSIVEVLDQANVPDSVRAAIPAPLPGQTGVLVGVGGHPAVLELFEHPDSFAAQWDAIVDGLLRSTLHVLTAPTPGRRARKFIRRLSSRPTQAVAGAGEGLLAEVADDLVSVRSLCTRDGHLVHTAALNVRHDLVLAA